MKLADMLNGFAASENRKNMNRERPLHEWPSDLLVWLFWCDEIEQLDKSCRIVEMIHAEMNARGEGERVAV